MDEYKKQLSKGCVQTAYRGLMEYMMSLRSHFQNKYPDYSVSGSIYPGNMDMTYFPLVPGSLRARKLKIALVFVHESFRFEVWLAGVNKGVQLKYWKLFKESNWNKYRVPPAIKGIDSIIEGVLADNPDFGDLDALTGRIEKKTLSFISDIEEFLSKH
jgi:hypothetical protein